MCTRLVLSLKKSERTIATPAENLTIFHLIPTQYMNRKVGLDMVTGWERGRARIATASSAVSRTRARLSKDLSSGLRTNGKRFLGLGGVQQTFQTLPIRFT